MSSNKFKSMSGWLQIKASHRWTTYDFKTSGVYFHYFDKAKSSKAIGQLFKNQIKAVKPADKLHKGAENCFEVHFSGPGSPWLLSAPSHESCIDWMECLQTGSSKLLKSSLSPRSPTMQPPSPVIRSPGGYHQAAPFNGYHPASFHESIDMGSMHHQYSPQAQNSHNGQHLNQSVNLPTGGYSADRTQTLPSRSAHPEFVENQGQSNWLSHSTPAGMTREDFMNASRFPHRSAVPNDYVTLGHDSVEQPEEPPLPLDDTQPCQHARSRSYPNARGPPNQQPPPNARGPPDQQPPPSATTEVSPRKQRPPLKPRSTAPQLGKQSSENSYLYMSSAGVPTMDNVYDDPQESMRGFNSSSSLPDDTPPRPPVRPRHTFRKSQLGEEGLAECNITSSSSSSNVPDGHQLVISPTYVDPLELNAKVSGGDCTDSSPARPPPVPVRRQNSASDKYTDAFRYFPTEQMRQLADMMKEVAGVCEGRDPKKQFSTSDLLSVLKKTSQSIPDQILNAEQEYDMGNDETSRKWARASSKPHGSSSTEFETELSDPIYQMQKDAFTIQKESLSDFKVIGKGQYGVVEAALYRPSPGANPIKVAIKKTKDACSRLEKDNFIKEIVVMAQFMHPNIVRVFGSVEKGVTSPWLVLEYLSNGDLKTFLKYNNRPVHRLVKYMVDIAMGMHYLSEKSFVHRDLAARNVFMDHDELCKVGDFGLLRETTRREEDEDNFYIMQSALALPVRWMAVECLQKQMFSSASDVWSFGVLMWELFNPVVKPYKTLDNMGVISMVPAGERLKIPEKCPKQVAQVMQACWNADYTKRPSFLVIANLLCRCIQHETPSSSSKT